MAYLAHLAASGEVRSTIRRGYDSHRCTEVSTPPAAKQVSDRVVDVTFRTPALAAPTTARMILPAGNGMAGGEFGGGGPADPGGFFLERATHDMSVSFHERLVALDIDHVWDDYGAGTHSYPYWIDGLSKAVPVFMDAFGEHRSDPTAFSYRSIEPAYDVFGWRVALDRPVVEFSELATNATGLVLRGSGSATVTTAPAFVPNQPYDVQLTRSDGSRENRVVRADRSGRLTLDVPLGAANVVQQMFLPTHESPLTTVYETQVSIARARVGAAAG